MTKKSLDILDFFKVDKNVSCPACGLSIIKTKLNEHLDSLCSSSSQSRSAEDVIFVKSIMSKTDSDDDFQIKKIKKPLKNKKKLSLPKKNKHFGEQKQSLLNKHINKPKNLEAKILVEEDDDIEFVEVISSSCGSSSTFNHLSSDKSNKVALPNYKKLNKAENSHSNSLKIKKPFFSFNKQYILFAETEKNLKCETTSTRASEVKDCNILDETTHGLKDLSVDIEEHIKLTSTGTIEQLSNNLNSKKQVKRKFSKIESCKSETTSENKLLKSEYDDISEDVMDAIFNDVEQDEEFATLLMDSQPEEEQKTKPYFPYYLANFKYILKTVLSEESNQNLFNNEDKSYVTAFESISNAAQKLYVRLFQRKYKWLRPNKLNYPEIAQDLSPVLDELVSAKLLDFGANQIDLETALDLLSLSESKIVIKSFNFNSSGKNKTEISQLLLKHCKEHKSVFFCNGNNGIATAMLKKVKQIMGPCYRISLLPKRLFTRILMLFSLPTISEDDDDAAGGQQQQLLTLLQVNKGELTFPAYEMKREIMIFLDRDDLIRYEEARQLESDILNAIESKAFDLGKELYLKAAEKLEEQNKCSFSNRASLQPTFLKRYTSLHVYVRCMWHGVEILQKLRQYNEAVVLLRKLLDQKVFCQDYRGRWYDRMALNLEMHLKQPKSALEAIKEALDDYNVRVGPRYSLLTRAQRIVRSADENDEFKQVVLKASEVINAPKVNIKGRLVPRTILGRKHVFVSNATPNDDVTVLGVEQLALEHYREEEGFPDGIHGEGPTFISLYTLLFWDIIYDGSIPDVFISPYQYHPLDLNSEAFFTNRETQIMNHLETIKNSTIDELKEIVRTTWELHHGQASLVTWDLFIDVNHVQGLISCFGNAILYGICERLSRDFRFTRSGVPDLVVWNTENRRVKIVEVKGPGDKLSSKQILWLDYLIKLGAEAEVCLVNAVQSKKLRRY